jgi:hypothetical protein
MRLDPRASRAFLSNKRPAIGVTPLTWSPVFDQTSRKQALSNAMWKKLRWVVALLIGIPVLGFLCVMLVIYLQERDSVYWGRIAHAKTDIVWIEKAISLYQEKYGRYPHELADLLPGADVAPNDKGFLLRVPLSPWSTPYHFEIEHSDGGDKIKLWTVPDQKTQERTKLTELSNETDWKHLR